MNVKIDPKDSILSFFPMIFSAAGAKIIIRLGKQRVKQYYIEELGHAPLKMQRLPDKGLDKIPEAAAYELSTTPAHQKLAMVVLGVGIVVSVLMTLKRDPIIFVENEDEVEN